MDLFVTRKRVVYIGPRNRASHIKIISNCQTIIIFVVSINETVGLQRATSLFRHGLRFLYNTVNAKGQRRR